MADDCEVDDHLSRTATSWSALFRAHGDAPEEAETARQELLTRYGTPIYRYLLGATRDPDRAADLFQEFAMKFLCGDFRRADPNRGRFRDFLKTALCHLIVDDVSRRPALSLTVDLADTAPNSSEDELLSIWREGLMDRAWTALEAEKKQSGQPLFTVLRFRTEHPELTSAQAAEQHSLRLGQAISAEWVRKWLHRSRQCFAGLLVKDVATKLHNPSREELEQELLELGVRDHCREALERYFLG